MLKNKTLFFAALGIIILYYFPFARFREAAYFTIHDNLDGFVPWLKITAQSKYFLASGNTSIPEIMQGTVERWMLGTKFNFTNLLFFAFPPVWAYIFNLFFVKIGAFISMFIFLNKAGNKYFQFNEKQTLLVSLLFALIPFYSLYGLAIAGIPLVFLAFNNIWEQQKVLQSSLILFGLSFFSYAPILTPYIVILLFVLLILLFLKKRFYFGALVPFVFLLLGFVIAEHQLLYHTVIHKSNPIHRVEFMPELIIQGNFHINHITNYADLFIRGTYHSGYIPVYLLLFFSLVLFAFKEKFSFRNPIILLLLSGFTLILVSYLSMYVRLLLGNFIPLLKGFSLERFFFFSVPIWVLLFGVLMKKYSEKAKVISYVIVILFSVLVVKGDDETLANWKQMAGKFSRTNFKAFYASDLFTEIENHIGKPKESYRVASVGIFPGVALYNGFYCVDAYMNTYPLAYKHQFRNIIAKELDKNEDLQRYFDYWGSRCYIFSAELGKQYEFSRKDSKLIEKLEINTIKLKELGCEYIFSALPIENHLELDLELDEVFEDKNGKWKIYLYEIK